MSRTSTTLAALAAGGCLLLTGACGSSDSHGSTRPAAGAATGPEAPSAATSSTAQAAPIAVVASTNVWGDIATQIAGDRIAVTAFISDPEQDPHSYEANAKNQLAVSKAQVVIENGGGYDDFVDRMLAASKSPATVINAVTVSGKQAPAGGELNEHVWYDFPTVEKVATAISAALAKAEPADAAQFTRNTDAFVDKLHALEAKEAAIRTAHSGDAVGITEPVPLYLLEAAGLVNKTPEQFSASVEEGTDLSPKVLSQTLDLYRDKQVSALVYNSQTSGPTTEQVLKAARAAGVPVVPVTETLPPGKDYLSWMNDTVDALAAAVAGS